MTALPAMPFPGGAAPVVVPSERRAGTRQRTFFAVGKLVVDGRERVCIVRNQSEQGVGIELDRPPIVGARVSIEARSLVTADATVMWSHDALAGLRLDAPIVSPPLDLRPRSPRFAFPRLARLIVEDRLSDVPLSDIALGGVRIGRHVPAGIGTLVVLLVGPYSLAGRICWHAAGMSGVRFTRPLAATELAAMLAWVQAPASGDRVA